MSWRLCREISAVGALHLFLALERRGAHIMHPCRQKKNKKGRLGMKGYNLPSTFLEECSIGVFISAPQQTPASGGLQRRSQRTHAL